MGDHTSRGAISDRRCLTGNIDTTVLLGLELEKPPPLHYIVSSTAWQVVLRATRNLRHAPLGAAPDERYQ